MRFQIIAWLCLLCASATVHAQSLVIDVSSTAGDVYKTKDYSISWTLGEVVTTTTTSNDHVLTQGFHQPKYLITAISEDHVADILVFPNPTREQIMVSLNWEKMPEVYAKVFSTNGKLLATFRLNAEQRNLSLANYPAGLYILQLSNQNNEFLKSYKINKIE